MEVKFSAIKVVEPLRFEKGQQRVTVKATGKDRRKFAPIIGRDKRVTLAWADDPKRRHLLNRMNTDFQLEEGFDEDILLIRDGRENKIRSNTEYGLVSELLYSANAMTGQFSQAIIKTFLDGMRVALFRTKLDAINRLFNEESLSVLAGVVQRLETKGMNDLFYTGEQD